MWFYDGSVDLEHTCLSVATNADAQRFIEVFQADPASEITGTVADAWLAFAPDEPPPDVAGEPEPGINDIVQIGPLGDCTAAIEPGGWTGIEHQVAGELSRSGRYAAVFNSLNGPEIFVYAADGTVVRRFEVGAYDGIDEVGEPLPEEADLPLGEPAECFAAALLLIERLTGARIEKEWLTEGRRAAFRHRDPTSGG